MQKDQDILRSPETTSLDTVSCTLQLLLFSIPTAWIGVLHIDFHVGLLADLYYLYPKTDDSRFCSQSVKLFEIFPRVNAAAGKWTPLVILHSLVSLLS